MSYIVVNEVVDDRGKVLSSNTYGPYRSQEAAEKAVQTMLAPNHNIWFEWMIPPEEYNLPARRKPLTEDDPL